ncbi:hypothetical protein PINS_up010928 [Pythium insidiosum]|nr:hypothetical protein PINS_up010928 [Pythium insidiosum]
MVETVPTFDALRDALLDLNQPMGKRTRAVFYLRTRGQKEDLQVLLQALLNRKDSELMRHELAYVIGQFQDADACETLQSIVEDEEDDSMVRHEAAEALGAIGHEKALPVLEKYCSHPAPEISETCEIAVGLIKYRMSKAKGEVQEQEHDRNPYLSVDPAPAAEKHVSTEELKATLLDANRSLFDRYPRHVLAAQPQHGGRGAGARGGLQRQERALPPRGRVRDGPDGEPRDGPGA